MANAAVPATPTILGAAALGGGYAAVGEMSMPKGGGGEKDENGPFGDGASPAPGSVPLPMAARSAMTTTISFSPRLQLSLLPLMK